ncbi:BTB/POZ protein [Rhizophagus irregularis DAOM 181602=DAOM 197198]|nr:BTB/POZ protein [Rhizophagus irregularis DAOM 181602=DAOM 197198]
MLSTNKKNNDGALVHIKLPNILPEIFQIILRYIYSGRISLEEYDTSDIIKILIAGSELVKDSNEILGGYNPIKWESNDAGNYGTTNDSFIFSFKNSDDIESYILRRVENENFAIHNYREVGPAFGDDLILISDVGICDYMYYEKQIRESTEFFSGEEYEVFQILN